MIDSFNNYLQGVQTSFGENIKPRKVRILIFFVKKIVKLKGV